MMVDVSPTRIGDGVRRPAGAWSASVQDLLRHVRARGIAFVPEPRGVDASGHETVSFVEGVVPAYPMPEWVWSERVLTDAAGLLRRYHDATVDFPSANRPWQLPAHEPVEVVCHNDFAPYNLVFRDRAPAAIIDFETASPGPRAWDLAYLAYRLVPLTAATNPDAIATADGVRAGRLRRLCEAYGDLVAPAAVLDVAPDRLTELADLTGVRAAGNGRFAWRDHVRLYRADAEYVRSRRATLL
jgi:aminoglycoside phosphotransferase (APT) family kinase protein